MGFWSDFLGTVTNDTAKEDVDRGHARPRYDEENYAASQCVDEALETGKDPISGDDLK